MKLWHISLISFKREAHDDIREETYVRLQKLAQYCGGRDAGIIFWQVGKNMDLRKGVHLVVVSAFEDIEALEKYKRHPEHKKITDTLREIADWQIGDIQVMYPASGA